MWIKAMHVSNKGGKCSQDGEIYSKGGKMLSESSHEGEVAR